MNGGKEADLAALPAIPSEVLHEEEPWHHPVGLAPANAPAWLVTRSGGAQSLRS